MKSSFFHKAAVVVVTIATIFSCDKIEEPYLTPKNNSGPPPSSEQKVMIEDFTGHKCTNCPKAHLEARNIQVLNPGKVIVVSIHSGFFATPDGSGHYTADYRSTEGNDISTVFNVSTYPSGTINRTKYSGKYLHGSDSWQEYVDTELAKTAKAAVTLEVEWNGDTRQVVINPTVQVLEDLSGSYSLCVLITEDSINSPQANNNILVGTTPVIDPYYHRHVFRKAVNGTWGEILNSSETIVSGTTFTKSYNFAIPSGWNADHCSVIAYVCRMDDAADKYSVIQVEEAHVVHSK